MIIDAIHLYSAAQWSSDAEEYATLSLDHATMAHPYVVQQVWGLDIDEILPKFAGSYEDDNFFDMMMKDRLVVLKIRLNPDFAAGQTASGLRDHLYRLIAPGRTGMVELRFMLGETQVAYIQGQVRKAEADLFSPSPTVQISVLCDFPLLRAPEYIELAGDPGVAVPDPILTDDISTAPHGFQMQLLFTGTVATHFTIQGKAGTSEQPFRINRSEGSPFLASDVLYFGSEHQNKYLYYIRPSQPTTHRQLIDSIGLGQVWPMMFPGDTELHFSSSSVQIQFIRHKPHWWGV